MPPEFSATSSSPPTTNGDHVASAPPPDPAVPYPGTIKINVQGAFIVDDEGSPRVSVSGDEDIDDEDAEPLEYKHDIEDIRLPNHTAVVSHVAVDVRWTSSHAILCAPDAMRLR